MKTSKLFTITFVFLFLIALASAQVSQDVSHSASQIRTEVGAAKDPFSLQQWITWVTGGSSPGGNQWKNPTNDVWHEAKDIRIKIGEKFYNAQSYVSHKSTGEDLPLIEWVASGHLVWHTGEEISIGDYDGDEEDDDFQDFVDDNPPTDEPQQITISGKVTQDSSTGPAFTDLDVQAFDTSNNPLSSTTTNNDGRYSLTLNSPFTGEVKPVKAGYTFNPTGRSFTNHIANTYGINFIGTFESQQPEPTKTDYAFGEGKVENKVCPSTAWPNTDNWCGLFNLAWVTVEDPDFDEYDFVSTQWNGAAYVETIEDPGNNVSGMDPSPVTYISTATYQGSQGYYAEKTFTDTGLIAGGEYVVQCTGASQSQSKTITLTNQPTEVATITQQHIGTTGNAGTDTYSLRFAVGNNGELESRIYRGCGGIGAISCFGSILNPLPDNFKNICVVNTGAVGEGHGGYPGSLSLDFCNYPNGIDATFNTCNSETGLSPIYREHKAKLSGCSYDKIVSWPEITCTINNA